MAMHFRDPEDPTKYQDKHDQIHLDETWFFLTWEKEIPSPRGEKPKTVHKTQITYHNLCAAVRPWYNPCVKSLWEGKLGIWPIGDWEPTKQKSKNRPKGTLVWKNKQVTKEVIKIYISLSCSLPSWRNGQGGTGCQEKYLYNKTEQKPIFVRMTRISMMH